MSAFVVDDIGKVVTAMRKDAGGPPYYIYDTPTGIDNRLQLRGRSHDKKTERYPLIALKLKISEEVTGLGLKQFEGGLNLLIAAETIQDRNAEERYEHVIKPILYPLYRCFFEKLRKSGLFVWDNMGEDPPHKRMDHPHFGTGDGENAENYLTDPLDAIEIMNLKIKQRTC